MKIKLYYGLLSAVLIWLTAAPILTAADLTGHLRQRIRLQGNQSAADCQQERICGLQVIPRFYERRQYRPAWVQARDSLPLLQSLVRSIREAGGDGLRVEDYHLPILEHLLRQFEYARNSDINLTPQFWVDLELLATDAFLLLGSHLLAGRVNPETIHSDWSALNPTVDMAAVLHTAIESRDVPGVLDSLRPPHDGYRILKDALRRYRKIAASGGWPALPDDVQWRLGSHDARIALLRQRLQWTGDLPGDTPGDFPHLFDRPLQQALMRFQRRHGLEPSGRFDPQSRAAMMVPAGLRARRIEINLERWRWLPHELGRRHIRVNVADFRLQVIEKQEPVLDMRVIVGRDYRRTPVFSSSMRYLVIHPFWNIPTRIATRDILPKVRRDPDYLSRKKIRVFEDWSSQAEEIDPGSVDWQQVRARHFRYRLRKEPGPDNDLGRIKFIFPNRFAVYLHDTPTRHLFQREVRSFSSGCVRLEKPLELARYLLQDDPDWSREDLEDAIRSGKRRVVPLSTPVPVHLLYWTVWAGAGEAVEFRPDVYGRDELLDRALRERPPRHSPAPVRAWVELGRLL